MATALLRRPFFEQACSITGGSTIGVLIGFLCPLCVPASAAFFSAIGLSFFPQKHIVFPFIAAMIVILLTGLALGVKRHGDVSPLIFGILGAAAVPLGRYIIASALLTYCGAFCVMTATIWNAMLYREQKQKYEAQSLGDVIAEQKAAT